MAGIFVVKNVYTQPASPHATGARLVFELFWLGVVYGALDGLLLSVFPVVASWNAFAALNWTLAAALLNLYSGND